MYAILFKKSGNVLDSNPNEFENPPKFNPGEFSSWWKVWLSHLVLLVKLALKNKMHNTIRLETQNQRVHQSHPRATRLWMDVAWTSYACSNYGVCLLGNESLVFIWLQRGTQTSIAHKTTSSTTTSNRMERGQLSLFPLHFPKLNCLLF